MTSRSITAVASRCLAMPPLTFPQVIRKMQRVSMDPDCSIPLVSSVLISDPMLSALVLSRANVGAESPIVTVSGAVAKLGLAAVQGCCLDIIAIPQNLRGILAQHWSQANACANMTRLLAKFCHSPFDERQEDEALIVCGLLHDLGNIAARVLFPKEYTVAEEILNEDQQLDFSQAMRREIGVTTNHIGALLCRAWHLPESLRTICRWYREPERAPVHREITALIHIAHNLVKAYGFTVGEDVFVAAIDTGAMSTLGLRQNDLLTCLRRYHEEADELALYESSFISASA